MSDPVSDLHAAARRFAANGIAVFPCWPDEKKPYTANGFHDATTDLATIDKWWTAEPSLNVAFCPHTAGLAVIDPDGEEGEASWDNWQIENGYLPLTYTVRTPRGGRHLYYRGILPPTQSKLGPHVDTRGVGSYVLVPPSTFEGRPYVVEDARAPADLGDTVGEYLRKLAKARVKAAVGELDLPQNVARAEKYLSDLVAAGRVAVEGQMGNKATYVTACDIMNLGLSEPVAFDLIRDIYNPACLPPWDEDELEAVVSNAARYAQNEAGAWAVETSADVFGAALDSLPDTVERSAAQPPKRRFRRWSLAEMLSLPPPAWLLPDMFPVAGVSLLYGQPSTLKTFLAVHWSCTLASLGVPVLYCAGEGSIGVARRIKAWCVVNDVDPTSLPLEIVRAAPWASDGGMIEEFIGSEVMAFKPDLIVMDTLARSAVGLDENSARDMGQVVSMMDTIRNASGAAVLVIHHSGKDESRGARGSGSLQAGVDAAFEVRRPSKSLPVVSVHCRRQKDAEERATPWAFEGRQVGGQLVMQEISVAEFHGKTSTLPKVEPKQLGSTLRAMGAIGEDRGVETKVLATALAVDCADTPEEADAAIAGFSTVLGKGAGGYLGAYCTGQPPALRWFVPA